MWNCWLLIFGMKCFIYVFLNTFNDFRYVRQPDPQIDTTINKKRICELSTQSTCYETETTIYLLFYLNLVFFIIVFPLKLIAIFYESANFVYTKITVIFRLTNFTKKLIFCCITFHPIISYSFLGQLFKHFHLPQNFIVFFFLLSFQFFNHKPRKHFLSKK